MNKSILVILLVLSVYKRPITHTTQIYNDQLETLNGNVRQLIEMRQDHTSDLQRYPNDTANFDVRGNYTEIRNGDGKRRCSITKYTHKYDELGRTIETTVNVDYDQSNKTVYRYDSHGRIAEQLCYNKQVLHVRTLYKYDMMGNVIELDLYDPIVCTAITKYRYDNKHYLKEEDFFIKNRLKVKSLYEYKSFDEKNNWLRKIVISRRIDGLPSYP